MSVCLEVWGDYACFTRPEMKTERVSYDVMTPSAARGIIEAIYWHPNVRWIIDRIRVCAPVKFMNIRRNEVKSKLSANLALSEMRSDGKPKPLYIATAKDIVQRAAMLLCDVRYVIEAHFDFVSDGAECNSGKIQDIATRRIQKGQFYHQPYFGCREFPANFAACERMPVCPQSLKGEKDLGWMLYDMDYSDSNNIRPLFFRATLRDGVLEVPPRDSVEVRG